MTSNNQSLWCYYRFADIATLSASGVIQPSKNTKGYKTMNKKRLEASKRAVSRIKAMTHKELTKAVREKQGGAVAVAIRSSASNSR